MRVIHLHCVQDYSSVSLQAEKINGGTETQVRNKGNKNCSNKHSTQIGDHQDKSDSKGVQQASWPHPWTWELLPCVQLFHKSSHWCPRKTRNLKPRFIVNLKPKFISPLRVPNTDADTFLQKVLGSKLVRGSQFLELRNVSSWPPLSWQPLSLPRRGPNSEVWGRVSSEILVELPNIMEYLKRKTPRCLNKSYRVFTYHWWGCPRQSSGKQTQSPVCSSSGFFYRFFWFWFWFWS